MPEAIVTFEMLVDELKKSRNSQDFANSAKIWYDTLGGKKAQDSIIAQDSISKYLKSCSPAAQRDVNETTTRLQKLHTHMAEENKKSGASISAEQTKLAQVVGKLLKDTSSAYHTFANEKVIEDLTKIMHDLDKSKNDIKDPDNKVHVQKAVTELKLRKEAFEDNIKSPRLTSTEADRNKLRHTAIEDSKRILKIAHGEIKGERSVKTLIESCINLIADHVNVPKVIQNLTTRTSLQAVINAEKNISTSAENLGVVEKNQGRNNVSSTPQ
jgi:hypothetical protein